MRSPTVRKLPVGSLFRKLPVGLLCRKLTTVNVLCASLRASELEGARASELEGARVSELEEERAREHASEGVSSSIWACFGAFLAVRGPVLTFLTSKLVKISRGLRILGL